MTFIDSESARRGSVRRLVTTRDANGNVIDESYNVVVGEHWVDLQPLSYNDRIAGEQLKIKATHKIFPELNYVPSVSIHDFYRIDGKDYRIVEPFDFRTVGYFRVLDGAFGAPSATTVSKLFFAFDNVGPGTHTFGSGIFSSVPVFVQTPSIVGLKTNDGDFYISNPGASGFTLVDRGLGVSPLATIYIWEIPADLEDIWLFSGIGPGDYIFGTAPLAGMPADFTVAPYVFTQNNNDGDHYLTNKTVTGFTIVDRGIGSVPSVSVTIIRQ